MWKTGNIKEIDDVFEGCTLLEEKIQKNNYFILFYFILIL